MTRRTSQPASRRKPAQRVQEAPGAAKPAPAASGPVPDEAAAPEPTVVVEDSGSVVDLASLTVPDDDPGSDDIPDDWSSQIGTSPERDPEVPDDDDEGEDDGEGEEAIDEFPLDDDEEGEDDDEA